MRPTGNDELADIRAAWAAAEARAEAAEQAQDRFLTRIDQELREALDGLIQTAALMDSTRLSDEQRCMLGRMRGVGETMSAILSHALGQAEIAAARIVLRSEPFPLGEALRSATLQAADQAAGKGIAFSVEIDPSAERTITGDAARLRQIVGSLVDNAVKFTERGAVAVSAGIDETGDCRIVVSDTGVGIPAADQADLFTGFQRVDGEPRRDGSPTTGLAQAQLLANLMGGRLECESMPRVGSAFALTLPTRREAEILDEPTPVARSASDSRVLCTAGILA